MKTTPDDNNLKDTVVFINRVSKVVKGGKRFQFTALVVVGDGQGWVGMGKGKGKEVTGAIAKGVQQAKKNLCNVFIKDGTIPYMVDGCFGAEHVVLRPAPPGTGIIAGGAVRSVMELAGIHNVTTKIIGRGNPFNALRATLNGLRSLRNPLQVLQERKGGASVVAEDSGYAGVEVGHGKES